MLLGSAGVFLAVVLGCGRKSVQEIHVLPNMKSIQEVQREYEERWMALPGVMGVGIGECEGRPCFKVLISGNRPPKDLPPEAEGYRVQTVTSDTIRALDSGQDSSR